MIRSIELGDRAGIAVAVACALHCCVAPILATSVQAAGVFASERSELAFLASSLLISGTTVVASCRRRGALGVTWSTFVFGSSLLVAARIGFEWVEPIEQELVIAGAGLVVTTHAINLFKCRCGKEGPSCVGAG